MSKKGAYDEKKKGRKKKIKKIKNKNIIYDFFNLDF